MAVSLAFYALGVSLESRPQAGASPLIPISIALGSLATLIFLGDVIYHARKELRQRRALKEPPPAFGTFDYGPEFQNAIQRYVQAEEQITDATHHTSEVSRGTSRSIRSRKLMSAAPPRSSYVRSSSDGCRKCARAERSLGHV
jgi:hypothetical protein